MTANTTRLSHAKRHMASMRSSSGSAFAPSPAHNSAGRTSTMRNDGSILVAPLKESVLLNGCPPHSHWNHVTSQCEADAGYCKDCKTGLITPNYGNVGCDICISEGSGTYLSRYGKPRHPGALAGAPSTVGGTRNNAVAGGPGDDCGYLNWCGPGSTCSDSVLGGTCIADPPPPTPTGGGPSTGFGVPDGGPCLDNWNCASNACNSFTCMPSSGGCLISGQCQSGEECSGGSCVPATTSNWCINDGNCGGTDVCVNGLCTPDNGGGGGGGCLADGTCVCQDAYGNEGVLDAQSNCVATTCAPGQGRGALSDVCMDCEGNGFGPDDIHCNICPAGFDYVLATDSCEAVGGGSPPVTPKTKTPPPVQCAPGFTVVSGSAGLSCGKPKDPPPGSHDPPATKTAPASGGNGTLYAVLAVAALGVAAVVMTSGKSKGGSKKSPKKRR